MGCDIAGGGGSHNNATDGTAGDRGGGTGPEEREKERESAEPPVRNFYCGGQTFPRLLQSGLLSGFLVKWYVDFN